MDNTKEVRPDKRIVYALIIIAAVLFLSNLGSQALWQDEGEVAILGKNILRTGLPTVDTETQRFTILGGVEYNDAGVWTYHPWLSHYAAAGSILVFGESAAGTRMFFAIAGLIGFIISLKLLQKLSRDNKQFYLAAFFLITNVSVFLYARQVRYYGLNILFTPLLFYFYLKLLARPNRTNMLLLTITAVLIFHANSITFFAVVAPLALHFIIEKRHDIALRKQLITSAIIIPLLTVPWIVYARPVLISQASTITLFGKASTMFSYFALFLNFTFPLLALAFLPVLLIKKGTDKEIFVNRFILILLAGPILIVALSPINEVRYIIGFAPLVALYYAKLFELLAKAWKPIAAGFLILIAFTNLLSSGPFIIAENTFVKGALQATCEGLITGMPEQPDFKQERCEFHIQNIFDPSKTTGLKFPFFYYLYELTHDFEGPGEVIINYLNQNANENDVVFTNYDHGPLIFNTKLIYPIPMHYAELEEAPQWIIPRIYDENRQDLIRRASELNAEAIVLDVVDQTEENYPNLYTHRFWTEKKGEPLVIYRVT